MIHISKTLAQQIVDTVKDLCGQNINFIDSSGIINASTDPGRIGSFHEIGKKAATNGTVIEVAEDDRFTGTQKGVNLPVYHNQAIIAVIGITGTPDDVRKYAHLAERITRLLIREKELEAFSRTEAEKKHHIIHALIEQKSYDSDYLLDSLHSWGIDETKEYRLLQIHVSHSTVSSGHTVLEPKLHQLFQKTGIVLHTFSYPGEYLAVIEESAYQNHKNTFKKFAEAHPSLLLMAAGKKGTIFQLADSSASCAIALKSLREQTDNYAEYDTLVLDIVLTSIDSVNREAFLQKTISLLTPEEHSLLQTYFSTDMSLKKTCEKLFLHKNTVQYKLDHIYKICGYNPRKFQDAVILYLALKL